MHEGPHAAMHQEMHAGWIEHGSEQLFACYHPARGVQLRDAAVLLCNPFGSQRMTLHLSYRGLAMRLAEQGFPVLRIDPAGTCDSSGYPREHPVVSSALAALDAGAAWLRAQTGLSDLIVLGAGLGGTIATTFAASRSDVTDLVLWGAYTQGRAYLRELSALRKLVSSNPKGIRPRTYEDGDQEALGFLLTTTSAREIGALDLKQTPPQRTRRAAVYMRGPSHRGDALVELLRAQGISVHAPSGALCNMDELVDDKAQPPRALLADIAAWCANEHPFKPGSALEPPRPQEQPESLLSEIVVSDLRGHPTRERVVHFGRDGGLFGIVTVPMTLPITSSARSESGVVLVNGGGNHRVGINRNYVEWARAWASQGTRVLRMDVRGLGDSPPTSDDQLSVLYRPGAQDDIREGIDFLSASLDCNRASLIGLCAGAYHSFHTALADPRVSAVMLLDPLRFKPVPLHDLRGVQADITAPTRRAYLKLLNDTVRLRATSLERRQLMIGTRRYARSMVLRVIGTAPSVARALKISTWMSRSFSALAERNCHVYIALTSKGGAPMFIGHDLAPVRAQLQQHGQLIVESTDDADHICSPLWSQEWLGERLSEVLARWR